MKKGEETDSGGACLWDGVAQGCATPQCLVTRTTYILYKVSPNAASKIITVGSPYTQKCVSVQMQTSRQRQIPLRFTGHFIILWLLRTERASSPFWRQVFQYGTQIFEKYVGPRCGWPQKSSPDIIFTKISCNYLITWSFSTSLTISFGFK
jgi:hypothetical protein